MGPPIAVPADMSVLTLRNADVAMSHPLVVGGCCVAGSPTPASTAQGCRRTGAGKWLRAKVIGVVIPVPAPRRTDADDNSGCEGAPGGGGRMHGDPGKRLSPECSARATAQRGQRRTADLIPNWLRIPTDLTLHPRTPPHVRGRPLLSGKLTAPAFWSCRQRLCWTTGESGRRHMLVQ